MIDLFLIDRSHPNVPISSQFNDFVVVGNDLRTLEGHERKRQDLVKAIITEEGSAIPFVNYGSRFASVVAQRASADIGQRIADSFKKTMAYLQGIEESTRPDERFKKITSLTLSATASSQEKRVNLVVGLEDGVDISTSFPAPI